MNCIKELDEFCNNKIGNSSEEKYGTINYKRQKLLHE